MSYKTIINGYITKINTYKGTGAFVQTFPAHTVSSSGGNSSRSSDGDEPQPIPSPVYRFLNSLCSVLSETQSKIYESAHFLYEDPEMVDGNGNLIENDNHFSIINGYADASKTFESYNSEEETFSEEPSYFWTRGKLYAMLPKVYAGEYLSVYQNENVLAKINSIIAICQKYQNAYDNYDAPDVTFTNSDNEEVTKSDIELFWTYATGEDSTNEEKFKAEIAPFFTDFASYIGGVFSYTADTYYSKFQGFKNRVHLYIKLFETATENLSKIDGFVSSLNKTVDGPNTRLYDTYRNIGVDGFSEFSYNLDGVFQTFLNSIALRDNSHYANEDTYNNILYKIFQSEILRENGFFEDAKTYLSTFTDFSEYYSLM